MNKYEYRDMQKNAYEHYSRTFDTAQKECVGNWDAHEKYPYEEYLLENYNDIYDGALDFGCGVGRMMKRMLEKFVFVDGADICEKNIQHAKQYLSDVESNKRKLFLVDGISCSFDEAYNFIYSTICMQHICVYETRKQILKDFLEMLIPDGQCCIQMGFGWDNGTTWFDNHYQAKSTNAGHDVCIPNDAHLPKIEKDFLDIGYKKADFRLKETPHPELDKSYHNKWIFIDLWK